MINFPTTEELFEILLSQSARRAYEDSKDLTLTIHDRGMSWCFSLSQDGSLETPDSVQWIAAATPQDLTEILKDR
jgi:hypothetical protein